MSENLKKALSMAEMAAADMMEAGLTRTEIATAMAMEMRRQISIAVPNPLLAAIWLNAATTLPSGKKQ